MLLNTFTEDIIEDISDADILGVCDMVGYQTKWGADTRINKIRTLGGEYFNNVRNIGDRTIVSSETYQAVLATVGALKNNPQSMKYLQQTDENAGIEFLYQQKFCTELNGLEVKVMFDILIVNHNQKVIIPIDLKTTSVPEYDFQRKFIENRYDIQSRLYYRVLKDLIMKDDYFKDFKICNFRFLVINKDSLLPFLFEDEKCSDIGDFELEFRSGYRKNFRDPITIGLELKHYLDVDAKYPDELDISKPIKIYERIYNSW